MIDTTNPEFAKFMTLFEQGKSIFLTGKAGTGKTTFIKKLIAETKKSVVVLASTGIAAVNIGGVTIHSFFRLPLQPLIPDDTESVPLLYSEKQKLIAAMDVLIIDEISMVRADILDAIDTSLRKNGGNARKDFGGKQIIFVGDAFQLEPIVSTQNGAEEILKDYYPLPCYFFDANAYKELAPEIIELKKVYRQADDVFLEILNRVRVGAQTQKDLEILNSRYQAKQENEDFTIELASTNWVADRRNNDELYKLKTPLFSYQATIEGKFDDNKHPVPFMLLLKEGAQVMFVKNDAERRWVNGTIAKVLTLTENSIMVELPNGEKHEVEKSLWENKEFRYDRAKRKVEVTSVGKFTQYPLKLAWSITIHKSQGLTFDKIFLNFGNGAFAAGQTYVALSRCTSLEGLRFKSRIYHSDIIVEERIKLFGKSIV